MKKMVSLVAASMAVMILFSGCSDSNKEMYESDINEFVEFYQQFNALDTADLTEYGQSITDLANEMDMQSDEGTALKQDFLDFGDVIEQYGQAATAGDTETLANLQTQLDTVGDQVEADGEAFGQAAEDAGVDEETVAPLYDE